MKLVKRHGKTQPYEPRKAYASVYAAALNAHHKEEDAERLAAQATKELTAWMRTKRSVTAHEIRAEIAASLPEEVRLLYTHHLDLS